MGSLILHHLSRGHALLYSLNVHFAENLYASTLAFQYSLDHKELTNHSGDKSGVILHLAQREKERKREDGPS